MAAGSEHSDAVQSWYQLLGLKSEKTAVARARGRIEGQQAPWMCEDFLIRWRSDEGDTVIHQLARKGWSKLLQQLFIDYPALRSIVSAATRVHGLTALHLVCMTGDVRTCKLLLQLGEAPLLNCFSMQNKRPSDLLGPGKTAAKLSSLLRKRDAEELAAFQSRDQREIWSPWSIDPTPAIASTTACTQEHPLLDLWSCTGPWPAEWYDRVASDIYRQRAAAQKEHPLTYGLVIGSAALTEFSNWLLHESPLLAPFRDTSPSYSPSLTSVDVTAIFASTAAQETGAVGGHQDQSTVTINFCLQTVELAGGSLTFTQDEVVHLVEQEQGRVLVHSGVLKHAVDPVRQGKRLNIIIWYQSN